MSGLPKSWCEIEIEQLLQRLDNGNVLQQGWSPQCEKEPANLQEWGVLKTTAIQEGYFLSNENKKLPKELEPRPAIEVKSGDILMTCAGPRNRCGVTSFVKETRPRLMMSGKMYRFRADPGKVDSKYLELFLLSQDAKVAIDRMKTGISDSGLNLTHSRFSKLLVPLAPLNEQKRIVAKIEELFSELDKGIENLKTAREQLQVYRQAALKHAFEGKLTAHWRTKNKISKKWNTVPLEWVIEEPRYGTSKKCNYDTPGIGVLRIPNIVSGVVDCSDLKFAQFNRNEVETYALRQGDILTIRSNGSVSIVGKSALIRKQDEQFLYAGYLIRMRPIASQILPEFLIHVLSTHALRNQIEQKAKSTSGVNNINSGEIKSLIIPLCGIQEQAEIVDILKERISVIENLEKTIEVELQKSEALRQSILKKAFSGKLVAQDPKDEPASVLLERIATQKIKPVKTSKNRKKNVVRPPATIIPFPHTIASVTTTDLHAGIIGLAYDQHEQNPRTLNTFGHVKAEKIAHLVEYHLGISLGREPIKDAAGPNDYRHLKKIEHRANKANWFSVQQRPGGEGYVFVKKRGFNTLLAKTTQALGDQATEVGALIRLLLPLNTQQAEILATLHAAWNNLLITGSVSPTDEEIVTEARENWHSSKLNIERERFFRGLEWLRKKQLMPKGMGQLVEAKKQRTA